MEHNTSSIPPVFKVGRAIVPSILLRILERFQIVEKFVAECEATVP